MTFTGIRNLTLTLAASTMMASAAFALADAEIAHIVTTANEGEIAAGKMAQSKASHKEVKDFAKHMVTMHTANQKEAQQWTKKAKIMPKANDVSKMLKEENDKAMSDLNKLKGAEFDKGYVDAQITAHQKVLNTIDQQLLPNAQSPDLKAMLEKTRPEVAKHLEQAQTLQTTLVQTK